MTTFGNQKIWGCIFSSSNSKCNRIFCPIYVALRNTGLLQNYLRLLQNTMAILAQKWKTWIHFCFYRVQTEPKVFENVDVWQCSPNFKKNEFKRKKSNSYIMPSFQIYRPISIMKSITKLATLPLTSQPLDWASIQKVFSLASYYNVTIRPWKNTQEQSNVITRDRAHMNKQNVTSIPVSLQ